MREGVHQPAAAGIDEFSPTFAPTAAHEPGDVPDVATDVATGVPRRLEDGADPLLGAILAERYRIDVRLGAGGMGTVYIGVHTALAKKVAIKVIQPRLGGDRAIAQRFVQEARAASAIGHEHIVQITDFGATPEGGSFLVMEYLEGEDLAETLRREGPLPWQRVIHIGEQIALALAAAHKHGIVHRDIKPANCYRVPRERDPDFIKVLDFGLAKILVDDGSGGESLTHTGMLLGTPGYIAPELYRGLKADHRVDLYSLGALMYKLLTGELPPMGGSDEHEPLRGLPAPEAVLTVLARTLREHPDHRWTTAHELALALRAIPRISADEPTLLQATTRDRSSSERSGLVAVPLTPSAQPDPPSPARGDPISTPSLSLREATPTPFASLVTVERDGHRVRLSLGAPVLVMLLLLVGGVVYLLTRPGPEPAPVAQVTEPPQPLVVAAPPVELPAPPPAMQPAPVIEPAPEPVEPAPEPLPTPEPEPPPAQTPESLAATKQQYKRAVDAFKRKLISACEIQDTSMFPGDINIAWRTGPSGAIDIATVTARATQKIREETRACVLKAIKRDKQTWDPSSSHSAQIRIKKLAEP